MRIPAWVSWIGLAEHAGVGTAVTLLCRGGHAAWWVPLVLLAGLGVWHEWNDGDFTTADGAPLNGIVDVLAFLAGVPLGGGVWILLHH